MKMTGRIVLAGLGVVSLGGAAVAADKAMHRQQQAAIVSHVAFADPSAHEVDFVPVRQAIPVAMMPVAMMDASDDPMFVDMQRMMSAMDARMDAMMRAAASMQASGQANGGVQQVGPNMIVSMGNMPAGTVSYSYVSTSNGNGCTQTVEMRSDGQSAQPKVIRTSSGDCGTEAPDTSAAARKVSVPAAPAAPAPTPKPDRRGNI